MLVLIVDSSIQIVERLEEILSEAEDISTIRKAVSYEDAIKQFNESKPDIVLLDIDLPGNKSIDLVRQIKKINAATAAIVLSIRVDDATQKQYNSLGADFFFDKYHDFEKLPSVVNTIAASKKRRH